MAQQPRPSWGAPVLAKAVLFAAVARPGDQAVLARYADKTASAPELRRFDEGLAQILQKAAKLPAPPGWRDCVAVGDRPDEHSGHVYVLADKQALCLVAVAIRARGYPERLASALLQEVLDNVRSAETDERLSEAAAGKLNGTLRSVLKEAVKKYTDPTKLDKAAEVQERVAQVKGLMQDNIKQILETHVTLDALQTKSSSVAASADKFLKQSVAVKRQVQLRNLRAKAVIACCSCALAACVLMPVFS
mmetsp:Transcript_129899/g.363565  ORF Transcript_129899/g.363565 Transcript_129899/m.363565 type:complete len:248 (-) Transcript_129899:58-801(-)